MKCAYKYCKHGGNVEKEDAVKINKRYWHKDCAQEQELKKQIKDYYINNFNDKEPIQAINTAIAKYIHKDGYEAEYVYYCLKHKADKLNSLYGLAYTLSYKKNLEDFKKMVAKNTKIVYNQDTSNFFETKENMIKSKTHKKWEDYFE